MDTNSQIVPPWAVHAWYLVFLFLAQDPTLCFTICSVQLKTIIYNEFIWSTYILITVVFLRKLCHIDRFMDREMHMYIHTYICRYVSRFAYMCVCVYAWQILHQQENNLFPLLGRIYTTYYSYSKSLLYSLYAMHRDS